jgi:hypothetical protein
MMFRVFKQFKERRDLKEASDMLECLSNRELQIAINDFIPAVHYRPMGRIETLSVILESVEPLLIISYIRQNFDPDQAPIDRMYFKQMLRGYPSKFLAWQKAYREAKRMQRREKK